MPALPRDMGNKKLPNGKWMYSFETTEVEVTPRAMRPPLPEGSSTWKENRQREETPDRALRKMKEKIKRRCNKAARGELDRIVAQAEPAERPPAGPTDVDGASGQCQALRQLDNPDVLEHLRAAFFFLASAQMHYCCNCDEEWVVFDHTLWPQGGVACAGPRAGRCETIARAGYVASIRHPDQ